MFIVLQIKKDCCAPDDGNEAAADELTVEYAVAEGVEGGIEQGGSAEMRGIVEVVCAFWVLEEEGSVERHVVEHHVRHKCHVRFGVAAVDDGAQLVQRAVMRSSCFAALK